MANDRFFIRCTVCGDYLGLGKYYPSTGPALLDYTNTARALGTFIEAHLSNCQPQGTFFSGPLCLVFDSEATLGAAGGMLGGSGNVNVDRDARGRKGGE